MSLSRHDRQTQAVVALIRSLTDKQQIDVWQTLGATPPAGVTEGPRHRGKPCSICGLIYPLHVKRWGDDDHPFETPPPRQSLRLDDDPDPDATERP